MDIRPDRQQVERLARQRQPERRATAEAGGQARTDRAELRLDPDVAKAYVERLKQEDPARLHRVEELRGRIADGSYRADPEELADRLLDALDRGALD